ncbi:hypothetical protein PR048_000894 [Dryococelus australis]|uniref:Reverse transcriptase domain-containing protein n=1 Tax=Dryococelus australis TaxID=614101 RepID=A0ABQ9IFV2_9NEOP|nr:hypothetical protein PR048_000894 [Dryococelus australis]
MLISTRGFAAARFVLTSIFTTIKSVACTRSIYSIRGQPMLLLWPIKLSVSVVVSLGIGLVCKAGGRSNQVNVFNVTGNGQNRQSENDTREDVFIRGLWLNALGKDKWTTTIKIVDFEKSENFLIDTGADVSCVPTSVVPEQMLQIGKKTEEPISGSDGSCLKVINLFQRYVWWLRYVRNVVWPREFNKVSVPLVNRLGKMKGTVKIVLKDGAKPFVQSVPRTMPIPLLNKFKAELYGLIQLDIIEPVMEPKKWVASIVVVPIGNAVHICGDYIVLESKLALLKEVKYFLKIDANSSFYQIELAKESQVLTTFIMSFGRYYFKWLPFGISCAPEYISNRITQVLENIPRVVFHVYDILIYASTISEHDSPLREVLCRLQNESITINKCKSVLK